MAFKQRHSKFKHVFGTPYKKDLCYDSIRITKSPWDSDMCDVNGKFFAVVLESQGGGAFIVVPLDKTGRIDINYPKFTGHKSNVLDLAFNPFDENVIASASEDCTVKIWDVPDTIVDNIGTSRQDLMRHQRKVGCISWHPTAEGVLASAGADALVVVWNVGTGSTLFEFDGFHSDLIYSLSWNYDGSVLATSCKDKKIRLIDPRKEEIIAETVGHPGNKPSRVVFCGSFNLLFSTGFSRSNDRQYTLWSKDLSKSLATDNLDSNSGTLFCYYDEGTKMVYLAGKGDSNIRYYEIMEESPYVQYLSTYVSSNPQRGLGSMPKRYLNHKDCEVMRFFKLHNKGLVEPLPMTVPRKSEMFQEDIYPPCEAGIPALSAEEWASGENKPPVLVILTKDGLGKTMEGTTLAPVKGSGKLSKQSSHSSTGSVGYVRSHSPDREQSPSLTSSGNYDEENRKLRSENQALKSENERLRSQLKEKEDVLHQIKKLVQ